MAATTSSTEDIGPGPCQTWLHSPAADRQAFLRAEPVGSAEKQIAAFLLICGQHGLKALSHRLLEILALFMIGASIGARLGASTLAFMPFLQALKVPLHRAA
jgi:hypothetical protein